MTEQEKQLNSRSPLPEALRNIILSNSIKMSSVGALFCEYDPNFLNNLIEYMKKAKNDGYGEIMDGEFVFNKSV